MSQWAKLLSVFLGIFLVIVPGERAVAGKSPEYLLKVATLAPEGSVWAKRFQEFVDDVLSRSGGEVGFKVYYGGVMGDDRSMYRKMQIGQLQGGGFTMTGIGEIVQDFRVMGIPFLFNSYEEVDRVSEGIFPLLQKAFTEKDLVLLAISEVGFVYPMSTYPIATIAEFKKSRCWAPENDPIGRKYLEALGVVPVPLSIPDVLPSLQTGLINTVVNGFYGSIVLQWYTSTKYVTNVPFGYAYGGLVLSKKSYDRLPPSHIAMLEDVARKHFGRLNVDTRKSNEEAQGVLRQNGVSFVDAAPGSMVELLAIRDRAVKDLLGVSFSEAIYAATMKYLEEARKR